MRAESSAQPKPPAQRGLLLALFVVSLILATSTLTPAAAQEGENKFPTGPGIDWQLPTEHRLFVNGSQSADNLDRDYPSHSGEPPFQEFGLGSTTVIEVESQPAEESVVLTGEAQVYVYASLLTDNDLCRSQQFLDGLSGKTSFTVWLDVGTNTVIDGEQSEWIAMENGWEGAHEFFINATYTNVTLGEGDVITLIIQSNHNCLLDGRVYWDAYNAATRAVLTGEMLQPELVAHTDANGLVRVEFTPISPWGPLDYNSQIIDLIGPLDEWAEARHLTTRPPEEIHVEHFEIPHGTRTVEANRTAYTWMSNATLGHGKYMLDACITIGAQDYNEVCHIIGVYRFEVEQRDSAMAGSGWFWLISIGTLFGWLGFRLKDGLMPWPTMVLLLILALASMGPAATLPELELGATRDDSAAPTFKLHQHPSQGSGSVSISDLLDERDALVLGVFTSGSPIAELQKRDFDNASERLGDDVAFAQMATGEGLRAVDIDYYAAIVNDSWPLLLDEAEGDIASQLPCGIADCVVIIDSNGFISASSPGSLSQNQIVNAVERSNSGSGYSIFMLFGLISSLLFAPLLLMSFPLRKTDAPEVALIPAAGLLGTIGAAAGGFLLWALPVALLAAFISGWWPFVELVLMIWLGWQGVSLAMRGEVVEITWLSKQVYNRLPEGYRNWRHQIEFTRDVLLGHWLAWLVWLVYPLMIPQGVTSYALSSLTGLILSPLRLVMYAMFAGMVILILRGVATLLGPISRILGNLSHKEAPRMWGCLLVAFALWWAVWLVLGPIWNMLFA